MTPWISALEVYVFRPPARSPRATFRIMARRPVAAGVEFRFALVIEGSRKPTCEVATWRRDTRGTWQRSGELTVVAAAEWEGYCCDARALLNAREAGAPVGPWLLRYTRAAPTSPGGRTNGD